MRNLKVLDLKSIQCPLNIVKIKLALEKLTFNETLIVEMDKGEPVEMAFNHLKDTGYLFYQIHEDESSIKIEILNEN